MKRYLKFLKIFVFLIMIPLMITQTYATNKRPHKKVRQTATKVAKVAQKINNIPEDNSIEPLTVDCAFSIGGWCICARHLENNKLRKTACPLDWMTRYSIDTAAHFFETKFADFFENIEIVQEKEHDGNRIVNDTKNHIQSIHYMPASIPFNQAYAEFKETMSRRAKKVDFVLSNSKSVLLVNCRYDEEGAKNSTDAELKNFARRFSKTYPNLQKIYLMDIHNDNDMKIRKRIVHDDGKIKIIQYKFKNIDKKHFYPGWMGNQVAWKELMKHIHLTNTVQEDNGIHATLFA